MSAVESHLPRTPQALPDPGGPPAPLPRRRGTLRALIALGRPRHWTKNVLATALPCFVLSRWNLPALRAVGLAIVLFTIASVCVYVLNDLVDRDRDRLHPVKRHRPLAAGEV